MNRDLSFAIAAVIVVLAVTFGLAAVRPDLPPTPSTPFLVEPGEAPRPLTNDRVVMWVNGEPVTEREFHAFLQQAPEEARAFYNSAQGRPLLADQLVKLKALQQEGRRLGGEKDPDAVTRLKMAQDQVMAAFALQKLVAEPNDTRLRAEYEKQKKNFESTELSHILISYQGGSVPPRQGPPRSLGEAVKKAEAIEELLRRGADFGKVARSESDDTASASSGGMLGPVQPASLPPELQRAVFGLKEGEISRPVKSPYGVHIFKAGSKEGRRFEELRPMFSAKLQRDDAELMIAKLQKSAKVVKDPKFFPPPPPQRELPPPRKGS